MENRISAGIVPALVAAVFAAPAPVSADEHENPLIEITQLDVKVGHWMKFRGGMEAYLACYEENEGEDEWSVWDDVEGGSYHIVSSMDGWAEMDETDEAGMACWSVIEEQIAPHLDGVSTRFARYLPDWSGEAVGYNVVRLHQFRVDEGDEFEQVVGEITTIMKEAEYEHLGAWYDVVGNDSDEIGYFVVEHFQNFAAIDDGRAGAYGTTVASVGEEAAQALWDRFGETLDEDAGYETVLLRRVPEMSRSRDDA